jgi:hypothetical protein
MTDNENAAYYLSRAEQEEEAASLTNNPIAGVIHLSLAQRYRVKALECEDGQRLRLVRD